MKKAITLILIFALLAGLAFATEQETHTIRLKSVVQNIRPEIQLKITSVNGNSSSQGATNNANDGRGNVFDGSNIYSYDGTVEIFSINEGGSVTFQAVLKNDTKTNEVYQRAHGDAEAGKPKERRTRQVKRNTYDEGGDSKHTVCRSG